MTSGSFPQSIDGLQRSVLARDAAEIQALFSADAVLIDDDRRYGGREIRAWVEEFCSNSSRGIHLLHAVGADPGFAIAFAVDGAAPSHSRWHIDLIDGRIGGVRVQTVVLDVPAVVADFVSRMNAHDLGGLVSCFASDAIANDQMRQFVGKAEIEAWLAREIVGDRVTMAVVEVRHCPGGVVILGKVTGTYDKTGLPDPLTLRFHVTVVDGFIGQLVVVPERPTA